MSRYISIYEDHTSVFRKVSAHVVLWDGALVATIAFSHPGRDSLRLSCYLHIIGEPMVKGTAGGYGYCKTDAAIEDAVSKLSAYSGAIANAFRALLSDCGGSHWQPLLESKGYVTYRAV